VTVIMLPEGRTGPDIVAAARSRGFTIAGGYGAFKERSLRIGHMGEHTVDELDALLGALDEIL